MAVCKITTWVGRALGGMRGQLITKIFIDEITRSGEKALKKEKKKTLERNLRLNIEQMTDTT